MRKARWIALAALLVLAGAGPARADSPWSQPVRYPWLDGYAHAYSHGNGMLTAAWQSFDGDPHVFSAVRPPGQEFGTLESFSLRGGQWGFRYVAAGGDGSRYFAFTADRNYLVVGRPGQPLAEPVALPGPSALVGVIADRAGDAAVLWSDGDGIVQFSWQPAGGEFAPAEALPAIGKVVAVAMDSAGNTFVLGDPWDWGTMKLLVRDRGGSWSGPVTLQGPPGQQQFVAVRTATAGAGSLVVAWERFDNQDSTWTIWAARYRDGAFTEPQELLPPAGREVRSPDLQVVGGPQGQAAVFGDQAPTSGGNVAWDGWRAVWLAEPGRMFGPPFDPPNGEDDRVFVAYGNHLGDSGFDALGNLVTTWRGPEGTKAAVKLTGAAAYCAPELLKDSAGQAYVGPSLALFDDGTGTVLSQGHAIAYRAIDHCAIPEPAPAAVPPSAAPVQLPAAKLRIARVARVSGTLRSATLAVICDGPGRCDGSIELRRRGRLVAARDGSRFSAAAAAQRKVRLSLAPRLRRELRAHRRVRAVAAVVVNGRTAGERTIALVRR